MRRAPPQAKERRQACGWRLRSACVSREACGLSRNNREQRRNHDSPGFYGRSSAAHHSSSLWEPANMIFSRGRHLPARVGRLGRPASTGKCNISTRSDAGTTENLRSDALAAAVLQRALAQPRLAGEVVRWAYPCDADHRRTTRISLGTGRARRPPGLRSTRIGVLLVEVGRL